MHNKPPITVRHRGLCEYQNSWDEMQQFTKERNQATPDEIWVVEHPAVFTMGLAAKPEHLLNIDKVPVVNCDRGGEVTYHGPGQIVLYTMLDLKRYGLGVRDLVTALENSVIKLLNNYKLDAEARKDAPGVYVQGAKIASIGLRIKRGCSYHGLSFNYLMDLTPFQQINPCGYAGLKVTQLTDLIPDELSQIDITNMLLENLIEDLIVSTQLTTGGLGERNTIISSKL